MIKLSKRGTPVPCGAKCEDCLYASFLLSNYLGKILCTTQKRHKNKRKKACHNFVVGQQSIGKF